jgi:hypothetical protein
MGDFGEAINYDLLRMGMSTALIPHRLSWYDLKCLLKHSPQNSAYVNAKFGEKVRWNEQEHMLATIIDQLNMLICKGTKAKTPKRIERPGQESAQSHSYGKDAVKASEFMEWFNQKG